MPIEWKPACRIATGLLIAILGLLGLCAQSGLSQEAASALSPLSQKLARRGDLTLRDTDLAAAIFTISESWGVNIVVGENVEGKVNGVFKNAPLHDILDGILLANGYGYRPVGDGIVVMKLTELGDANPMFQAATVSLRRLEPADAAAAARMLLSRQGRIEAVGSARSVLVVDYPEHVQKVREMLMQLDAAAPADVAAPGAEDAAVPMEIVEFHLQYAKAEAVVEAVTAMLSSDGKAAIVKESNRLVVQEQVPRLPLVHRLVAQLDQPRRQVRITALIYDISVKDVERLGLNWRHSAKGSVNAAGEAATLWSFDTLLNAPAAAADPSGVMTFMSLSRHFDFTSVVDALRTADDARLLADPSVLVLDGEEANIRIVTEIPYQQLTQTSQGGNIGTVAFREAGVTLKVAPHIARDDTMQLRVTPAFSRLAGFTSGDNAQPIIDQREAQTSVRVASGQTLVIGGLRQRTEITGFNGIPVLKDIKKVGKLFQSHTADYRESELVVFLLPEIVPERDCMPARYQDTLYHATGELDRIPTPSGYANAYERGTTVGLMIPCCEHYPHCRCARKGGAVLPGPRYDVPPPQPELWPPADEPIPERTPSTTPGPGPRLELEYPQPPPPDIRSTPPAPDPPPSASTAARQGVSIHVAPPEPGPAAAGKWKWTWPAGRELQRLPATGAANTLVRPEQPPAVRNDQGSPVRTAELPSGAFSPTIYSQRR